MSEIAYEKLEQLVFDENKLVSCKLLTKVLKININIAKKYLQEFFTSNQSKINAHFIVIGLQEVENKQFTKIIVVPYADLDKIRDSFISITSCHIYCIHKGELVDKTALISDSEGKISSLDLNKFSSVRNSQIHIQSPKKVTLSPQKSSVLQVRNTIDQKKQTEVKKEDNITANQRDATADGTKLSKKDESKTAKNKGSSIFSMFQKQVDKKVKEDKIVSRIESPDKNSKSTEEKTKNQSPKTEENKIKQLFSKQTEKNVLPKEKESEKNTLSSTANHTTTKNKKSNQKRKHNRTANSGKSKSESESEEDVKPKKKKHRRIVEVNDSDSESENEELLDKAQRELTECEQDPSIDTTKMEDDDECIPPTQNLASGKIKKWKDVTKTFQDEDGFFVTKRTKEYVTASEESEDESTKVKKVEKPKEIINKATFANKKQASLTSFFKQK